MKYDNPELREQLAAEYVIGTMPILARRRFERLLVTEPGLRQVVEDWNARFGPIDHAVMEEEPPARVWRAVERRLALAPPPAPPHQGWLGSLAFWRVATFASAALAAAALLYLAVRVPPLPTTVVAVLSDDKGDPGWIALGDERGGDVGVAPVRQVAVDAAHAFELWAIAKGPPRALGLLAPQPGHPLQVQASMLPPEGGVLAVSIEPVGGSPTGLPTGAVLYKGTVLPREP